MKIAFIFAWKCHGRLYIINTDMRTFTAGETAELLTFNRHKSLTFNGN